MKTRNGKRESGIGNRGREKKEKYTLKFRDMDSFPPLGASRDRDSRFPIPDSRFPFLGSSVGGILTIPKSDSYLILVPKALREFDSEMTPNIRGKLELLAKKMQAQRFLVPRNDKLKSTGTITTVSLENKFRQEPEITSPFNHSPMIKQ